jgi:hypothetical protein
MPVGRLRCPCYEMLTIGLPFTIEVTQWWANWLLLVGVCCLLGKQDELGAFLGAVGLFLALTRLGRWDVKPRKGYWLWLGCFPVSMTAGGHAYWRAFKQKWGRIIPRTDVSRIIPGPFGKPLFRCLYLGS